MPSYDLVSKLDISEVKNAVNMAQKEISTRYDFRGSNATVELKDSIIELRAEDETKIKTALDILRTQNGQAEFGDEVHGVWKN